MLAYPPLTVQQLREVMSLSEKQTEDDLMKINEWLKVNKLSVIYVKSEKTQPVQLTEEIHHFQDKKRQNMIDLFIRQEAVSTHQSNLLLKVSRNTSMAVI